MFSSKLFLAPLFALTLTSQTFAQTRQRPAPPSAGVNVTAADMTLVVAALNLPRDAVARLKADAAERKKFAADIRQMLGAAEEARALGYAARPELKLQMELARDFEIAKAYFILREQAGQQDPAQIVSQDEIDAFFKEPTTASQFEAFVEDYTKNGPNNGTPVTEEQRKGLTEHYGRVMVAMRKGVAAGVGRDRKTQLAIMLQQERILAGAYSKEQSARFNATDAEVDAYVAKHPEYDTKQSRAKAEELVKRARAGEDFAKLAQEFSQDRGSKALGGDLGWFGRGEMLKPFEDAAFSLKAGEVSGVVETQFGYHVIKVEGRRTQNGADGKPEDQVHARHILIRYNSLPLDPNAPTASPREQARAAAEQEKQDSLLDGLAARRNVRVAEDFPVESEVTTTTPPKTAPNAVPQGSKTPVQSNAPAKQTNGTAPARRRTPRRDH